MINTQNQKGFTLIELLVVTMILGILAGIAFALLNPAVLFGQARDSARKADLKNIAAALQIYYNDNKAYPNSQGAGDPLILAWQNPYTFFAVGGTIPLVPNYMKSVPKDPLSTQSYQYTDSGTVGTCSDNQSFALVASLERGIGDSQAFPNKTVYWCDGSSVIGGVSGNYYVTSP